MPTANDETQVEVVAPVLAPEPSDRRTAAIIAGGTAVPKADIIIVVERATFKRPEGSEPDAVAKRVATKQGYPAGAQTYLRYDPEVNFPADAEVLTMGVDVQQGSLYGFTRRIGELNVGPASPVYAAANLAYQRGATHIEIVGASDAEKERLQHYFDRLSDYPVDPAQVTVSFS